MDEDWSHNEVLQKDCLISAAVDISENNDIALNLSAFDPNDDIFDDIFTRIKMEPSDETSDYHGSSSGSPSSSLSSPNNLKDEPLGLDVNFCVPFTNTNFSPAPGSSHSPGFGMMNGGQQSPLPPVGHFSHHMHPQQVQLPPILNHHSTQNLHQQLHPQHYGLNQNQIFKDSMFYEGIGGMGLAVAQQQLKSRNKMHEMAVKQRLISDQGIQGNGEVQLSSEERRTLIQEGYAIPSRLPLTKNEEEALKIVRRKIKNKLSAQESRRKRKEYLDALEIRVQGCVQENNILRNRIRQLEAANRDLTMQVQQYEEQLGKSANSS